MQKVHTFQIFQAVEGVAKDLYDLPVTKITFLFLTADLNLLLECVREILYEQGSIPEIGA